MLRRILLLTALCLPLPALAAGSARTLVFLGTADQHGHIEQAGRLAYYFDEERRRSPGRVVAIDAGDMFQGTLASNLHEGAAMIHALNALGYAAAAIGNHEFDFGPVGPHVVQESPDEDPRGALLARAHEAKFPLLSCNIVDDKTSKPLFKAWTMLHVDGANVAIVGATTEDVPRTTNRRNLVGLRVLPLAPAVGEAAKAARAAGATVVILAVHAGGNCAKNHDVSDAAPGDLATCEAGSEVFQLAHALATAAQAGTGGRVDAIFGGHTHAGVSAVVAGIPILQAYDNARAFAKLELEVDARGVPTGHFVAHAPTPVAPTVPPDAAVARAVAGDIAEVEKLRAERVGIKLATVIARAYRAESPLGNLVADTIRTATAADIGLTNGGGLRADLPAGELTYGDLFQALPFDNRLATMTLSGAAFRDLLMRNLSHDKGILSVSGIHVHARCAAGKLVIDGTLSDGSGLEDKKSYKIGTTDFLANGGDDFGPTVATHVPAFLETSPVRDVVATALRKRGGPLDEKELIDRAHPRLELPGPRPIVCK
jgi:5'-nucleotidase